MNARELALRDTVRLTPEEEAHDLAIEQLPGTRDELLKEIARARNPEIKRELMAQLDETPGTGGGTQLASFDPARFEQVAGPNSSVPDSSPAASARTDFANLEPYDYVSARNAAAPVAGESQGIAKRTALSLGKGSAGLLKGVGWLLDRAGMGDSLMTHAADLEQDFAKWQAQDPETARQLQAVEGAKGFTNTLVALKDNPRALADMVVGSMPALLPGIGTARFAGTIAGKLAYNAALKAGAEEGVAAAAAQIATEQAAAKAAQAAASAAKIAGTGGAMVGNGVTFGAMTGADVQEYLRSKGMTQEKAEQIANEAALKVGVAATLLSSVGKAGLEAKIALGEVTDAGIKGAAKNIGLTTAESAAQMAAQDAINVDAKRNADPSLEFDLGSSLAKGAALGVVQGAPMHALGRLTANEPTPAPKNEAPAASESPIKSVYSDSVLPELDAAPTVEAAIAIINARMNKPLDVELGKSVADMAKEQQIAMASGTPELRRLMDSLAPEDRQALLERLTLTQDERVSGGLRSQAIDSVHRTLDEGGVFQALEAQRRADALRGSPEEQQTVATAQALFNSPEWMTHRETQPGQMRAAMEAVEQAVANPELHESHKAQAAQIALDYAAKRLAEPADEAGAEAGKGKAQPAAPQDVLAKTEMTPEHGAITLADPATFGKGAKGEDGKGTIGTAHARMLQVLGRALGRDVQFFRQDGATKHVDGFVHPEHPDTIFLNQASSGAAAFHAVMGHEFFHSMPGDIKSAFIHAIRPELSEENFAKLQKYINQPEQGKAAHLEEIAADLFGNRFGEADTLGRVFDRIENPTLAQRLFDYVRGFIDTIARTIGKGLPGFKTDEYVGDLNKVRDAFVGAMKEHLKRQDSGDALIGGRRASELTMDELAKLARSDGTVGDKAKAEIARRSGYPDYEAVRKLEEAGGKLGPQAQPEITLPAQSKTGPKSLVSETTDTARAKKEALAKRERGELLSDAERGAADHPLERNPNARVEVVTQRTKEANVSKLKEELSRSVSARKESEKRSSSYADADATARLEQAAGRENKPVEIVTPERMKADKAEPEKTPQQREIDAYRAAKKKELAGEMMTPAELKIARGPAPEGAFPKVATESGYVGREKGGEQSMSIGLSAATDAIPGMKTLVEAARYGDNKAHALVQQIAVDNLKHLLRGTKARVKFDRVTGVYEGSTEPSIALSVTFKPEERKAVLAALAKFAENFAQKEIHVRQETKADFGAVYDDGSYSTPSFRWTLRHPLSAAEVEKVRKASGLAGLTFSHDYVEAYYVGNPRDTAAISDFIGRAISAHGALGERVAEISRVNERLWAYGDRAGAIPYERIKGDVPAGFGTEVETARHVAEFISGNRIKGSLHEPITEQQRARQSEIARVYDSLPVNDLSNPDVRRAYAALAHEVTRQFQQMPVKVEVYTGQGEPYANSRQMRRDINDNNHLYIFATEPGKFGPQGFDFADHPMLAPTGLKDINGRPLLINDLLRAVHDYFAHDITPVEFGPKGEEAAWKNHMAMTNDSWARWALTTETRGQNSWVNFRDGADGKSPAERGFADQKAALLPIEYTLTGEHDIDTSMQRFINSLDDARRRGSAPAGEPNQAAAVRYTDGNKGGKYDQQASKRSDGTKPLQSTERGDQDANAGKPAAAADAAGRGEGHRIGGNAGAGLAQGQPTVSIKPQGEHALAPVVGIHYGKVGGVPELLGDKYSTGLSGAEKKRLKWSNDPRISRRVYFYPQTDPNVMPTKEGGLGPHVYTAKLGNLYDLANDPLKIREKIADIRDPDDKGNAMESAIVDAGYDGYRSSSMIVVLDGDVPVTYLGENAATNPHFSVARNLGALTPSQQAAAERVLGKPKEVKEKLNEFRANWKKNLIQGVLDTFQPLKDLDPKAYMLARMSKGGDSTLEALMLYGKVFVDQDGFYDVRYSSANGPAGFAQSMAKMNGEHDRLFLWVAAQRAEQLKAVGLENLFSAQDIAALKTLDQGNMKDGTPRAQVYAEGLRELTEFNESVLKIAEDSGLIDSATRAMYAKMPYVPFYRLQEEGAQGFGIKAGLVNQQAWKSLKGGTDKLNADLMANTLQNWSHLITASAKNRAAKAALEAAKAAGIAIEVPNGMPGKGLVSFKENGRDRTFMVSDPHVMDAITGLESASLGAWSKPFIGMKRALTVAVTANPAFKIRNLIRDSIQSVAVADMDGNLLKNVSQGWKATAADSETRAKMLAGGGMIRFGSMLDGNSAERARELVKKGVDPDMILDSDSKVVRFWKDKVHPAIEAYQELGDRGEQINRAALYERLVAKGMSHGEANFWARDLMDFSGSGKWTAVRTLTQVVPFMNARLQGLYKLGNAGKEDIKRLGTVMAVVAFSSIGLMLAYKDDPDWNKREDWDRQNYWWFKVGDTAFRIPKPFEIGAVGTIAEMGAEYFASQEMGGQRFMSNLGDIVGNQLNMNPVPQLVKPMLDVYANMDSFTKRPIENMAQQRLQAADRFGPQTSEAARFLGSLGLPDPIMLATGHYEQLSPVKVDALIKGYFGWLGTMTTTALDYGIRPMLGRGEKPEMQLRDVFLAGNFAETLPANSSRYVSQMYEQAKEIEQAYASYQKALKSGDLDKARSMIADNGKQIASYQQVESVKREESRINQLLQQVQDSRTLSGETKRKMIDMLSKQRDQLARAVTR